jgi:hypothetical protein
MNHDDENRDSVLHGGDAQSRADALRKRLASGIGRSLADESEKVQAKAKRPRREDEHGATSLVTEVGRTNKSPR